MRVVIVGKTRMRGTAVCVGGLNLEDNRGVRLLQPNGSNHPLTAKYDVGQIWDLEAEPAPNLVPPHVEDVLVHKARLVGTQRDMRSFLLRRVKPWRGGFEALYGGLLQFTNNGSAYISRATGVPPVSTGFWIPNVAFRRVIDDSKTSYRSDGGHDSRRMKYVGFASSLETIQAGTLLRVSLARWWRPDAEPERRCYLQLSGWFL